MSALEETLLPQARRLFMQFFPGLVERLEGLGGKYLPLPYAPLTTRADRHGKRAFKMSLAYHVSESNVRVDIALTLEISPGSKTIVQHSYHLGPYASDEYIVRLCESLTQPHHFHLRGWAMVYQRGHIPANRADPPLSRNPLDFLSVVEHFIKTNQVQIQVKK